MQFKIFEDCTCKTSAFIYLLPGLGREKIWFNSSGNGVWGWGGGIKSEEDRAENGTHIITKRKIPEACGLKSQINS